MDERSSGARGKSKSKKVGLDAGGVWLEALVEFGEELHGHVEGAKADQLRFQKGRLYKALVRQIKAVASGKDEWHLMFVCYQLVTDASGGPGYGEAFRLHDEEMRARGLFSPCEFCLSLPERLAVAPEDGLFEELQAYVRSLAWWMEAQESFSLWLVYNDFHQGWRGNIRERAQAVSALYLSRMHKDPGGARVRTSYEGVRWSDGQWRNILRQAAGMVEKRYECTGLEAWVWWCYPVFRRYGWNVREVLEAASRRGMDFGREKAGIDRVMTFQKYWIRRGLRFSGGKQRQDRVPPLAEFVFGVVLPDPNTMWGKAGGFLFPSGKKTLGRNK